MTICKNIMIYHGYGQGRKSINVGRREENLTQEQGEKKLFVFIVNTNNTSFNPSTQSRSEMQLTDQQGVTLDM